MTWNFFDPNADWGQRERNRPHRDQPGAVTFITARLADSMPREVILRWEREQAKYLAKNRFGHCTVEAFLSDPAIDPAAKTKFRKLRNQLWQRSLDDCHGECVLKTPINAKIVADTLLHFDADRYDVDSLVVMPNHWHLLVQMRVGHLLGPQVESWQRFSARRINQRIGKSGVFWQAEPFDHVVRGPNQFTYLRNYIAENPKKANLPDGQFLFWNREAGFVSERSKLSSILSPRG